MKIKLNIIQVCTINYYVSRNWRHGLGPWSTTTTWLSWYQSFQWGTCKSMVTNNWECIWTSACGCIAWLFRILQCAWGQFVNRQTTVHVCRICNINLGQLMVWYTKQPCKSVSYMHCACVYVHEQYYYLVYHTHTHTHTEDSRGEGEVFVMIRMCVGITECACMRLCCPEHKIILNSQICSSWQQSEWWVSWQLGHCFKLSHHQSVSTWYH